MRLKQERNARDNRLLALIPTVLAVFMSSLDMNIVNLGLPLMSHDFQAGAEIKWVTLAYLLPGFALLPMFGAWSDIVGRKKIFLAGIAIFTLGSLLCGLAGSLSQMVLFRAVQGIGASGIAAPMFAIVASMLSPEERGKGMAIMGMVGPLGGVTGPTVGGLLVDVWGWSSLFWINVPIGLISSLLLWRYLPESADGHKKRRPFDVLGIVLLSLAILSCFLALSPEVVRSGVGIALFIVLALSSFALFIAAEKRASYPAIPLTVMKETSYLLPLVGIMASSIIGSGIGFLNPFFIQGVLGLSSSQTGLIMLCFPLGMIAATRLGGKMSDRAHPRISAAVGASIVLVGLLIYLPLNPEWTAYDIMSRLFVMGFGHGWFVAPSSAAAISSVPVSYMGIHSAMMNMFRTLGFALGPTLAAMAWSQKPHLDVKDMRMTVCVLLACKC